MPSPLELEYLRGFKDGYERGAYEEMTQEDVATDWSPWNGALPFFMHSMLCRSAVKAGILRKYADHPVHKDNCYITQAGQLWVMDDAVPLGDPRAQ